MPIYCATFNRRQQRSLPRKAILALLSFILPLLTNLINLKFQNESNSVFQARPRRPWWLLLVTGICLVIWNRVHLPFFSSLSYLCCCPPYYHGVFRFPLTGIIGFTLVPRCMETWDICHLPPAFTWQLLVWTGPKVVRVGSARDDGQTADCIHKEATMADEKEPSNFTPNQHGYTLERPYR
ncbi:hypothetical protein CK203_103971 [Vitis vinifera]|uniref:Uncharacterized protein n=1 Tax=Vitis vinifera TaxID=29760 RepID=A0A438FIR2_VITVI|nr:hypothetical protein CK203_103971 [Vitis vinifera]